VPAFAVFVLLWSSGYVVGSLGVEVASPLGLLSVRLVLAVPVAILLARRVPGWRSASLGRIAVAGVLLLGVQFAGVYGGLSLGVPAALSSLVVLGLAPLATAVLAMAAGLERPDRRVWLLLAIGIGGVALSVAPELDGAQVGIGLVLTVVGMLGLSAGTVLQKGWAGAADPRVTVAIQLLAVSALMIPAAAATGQFDLHPSVQLGWTVAWLAWPLSIGATSLFAWLLDRHDASTVTAVLLTVPAVTAVESALVLGERLSPVSLLGMAVSTAAVYGVVRRAPAPQRTAASPPPPAAAPAHRPSRRRSRASGPSLRARPTAARR
jgi:drug/metabolite transporter (DMT)-like permease